MDIQYLRDLIEDAIVTKDSINYLKEELNYNWSSYKRKELKEMRELLTELKEDIIKELDK